MDIKAYSKTRSASGEGAQFLTLFELHGMGEEASFPHKTSQPVTRSMFGNSKHRQSSSSGKLVTENGKSKWGKTRSSYSEAGCAYEQAGEYY